MHQEKSQILREYSHKLEKYTIIELEITAESFLYKVIKINKRLLILILIFI